MNKELTLRDFYVNFLPFADSKTAYHFARILFADYVKNPELYFVENRKIVFDKYASDGKMDFDHDGIHDSGLRTPELWQYDGDGEYFIRWCWYPE